jgi:hypothetical protein
MFECGRSYQMFCLAVYITIQSGLDPCVCDMSCITDRNFNRVQKQNQILNHKTKQRPKLWSRYGAPTAGACLELSSVISCTTHFK